MTEDAGRPGRALLLLALAVCLTHGLYQSLRAFFHYKQGLDFTPGYVAAKMLVKHGDRRAYQHPVVIQRGAKWKLHGAEPGDPVVNYAYPPWVTLVYVPFAILPWEVARRLWFLMGFLAVFGAAAVTGAAVAPRPADRRAWALGGLAAAGLSFPVAYGLMAGQANDLPLLSIALSLWFLKTGRPFLAGLVLAPAALWKIFTGFPVLFLVARREWRAVAGLALGCAVLVAIVIPTPGFATWLDWASYMGSHNQLHDATPRNHSLANAVWLLLRTNSLTTPLADAPALAHPVTLALQGAALLVALAALVPATRRDEPRYALQFSITLVVAVLLVPKASEHYGIFLLPALLAAFAVAAAEERPAWGALALLGLAFAAWGLLLQHTDDYRALASRVRVVFYPTKTWATLILLALCAWLARPRPVREGAS